MVDCKDTCRKSFIVAEGKGVRGIAKEEQFRSNADSSKNFSLERRDEKTKALAESDAMAPDEKNNTN